MAIGPAFGADPELAITANRLLTHDSRRKNISQRTIGQMVNYLLAKEKSRAAVFKRQRGFGLGLTYTCSVACDGSPDGDAGALARAALSPSQAVAVQAVRS